MTLLYFEQSVTSTTIDIMKPSAVKKARMNDELQLSSHSTNSTVCGALLTDGRLEVADEVLRKRADIPLRGDRWPIELHNRLDFDRGSRNEDFVCRAQFRQRDFSLHDLQAALDRESENMALGDAVEKTVCYRGNKPLALNQYDVRRSRLRDISIDIANQQAQV